jgi:hypothetical protein
LLHTTHFIQLSQAFRDLAQYFMFPQILNTLRGLQQRIEERTTSSYISLIRLGVSDFAKSILERAIEGQKPFHKLCDFDRLLQAFWVQQRPLGHLIQGVPVPFCMVFGV